MTQPDYDPKIIFEDIQEFIDPIIIAPALELDLIEHEHLQMQLSSYRTLIEGIQVHVCLAADPDAIYVVDRPNIVDEDGNCLVCGGPTI